MKTYCLRCKTRTEDRGSMIKTTKNNRRLLTSLCSECNAKKARFVSSQRGSGIDRKNVVKKIRKIAKIDKIPIAIRNAIVPILKKQTRRLKNKVKSQRGGALARPKARTIDKVAEGMSMFLSGPAPSFAKLGLKVGTTAAKALKGVIDQYRRS